MGRARDIASILARGGPITGNLNIVKPFPVIHLDDTTNDVGIDVAIGNLNENFYIFEPEDTASPQVPGNLGREWFRIDDDGEAYLHQTKRFWHNALMPRPVTRVSHYENTSMITASTAVDQTYFSFTVTKISSTSLLYVTGAIPYQGSENHGTYWYVSFNGTRRFQGAGDGLRTHTDVTSSTPGGIFVNAVSQGSIPSGTVTIGFGEASNDGTANRPLIYINPNNSIDGRNRSGTVMTVWEVEQ